MFSNSEGLLSLKSPRPFYKNPKIILFGILSLIVFLSIIITIILVATSESETLFTIIPSKESNKVVINPDQGFYRHLTVVINETHVKYNSANPDSLYHLRCDISAFSKANNGEKDKEFTKAALTGIDNLLQKIRTQQKNAIVRFTYDPGYKGNSNKECEMSMVIKHIHKLGEILNKYPDVLTAIEAGMLGRWAEMHGSDIVTAENVQTVIEEWLKVTHNIPILVRYPKFLYYFCNKKTKINEVENITFTKGENGYYLGMFNDGMFGNSQDLGTWMQNRSREMKWISKQNAHLPYGGETENRTVDDVYLMKNCIPEMFMNHLSHLNLNYNTAIHDKWKKETYNSKIAGHEIFNGQTAYDFIYAHFGYRLVVKEIFANITSKGRLKIKVKIDNNGFGFVNKEKKVGLIYSYDNKTLVKIDEVLTTYYGNQSEINIIGKLIEEPKSDYYVLLSFYYKIEDGVVKYPIRLANEDIYNENLAGNMLFKINKENNKVFK